MKKPSFLKNFSVFDLVLLAMLTSVSIAFKAVLVIFVQPLTRSIGIPGGAPIGGLYMFWLTMAIALTKRHGAAFFISLIQAIVLLITGIPGTHGIWSFATYLLPGIAVEIVMLIGTKKGYSIFHFMAATALSNIVGVYGSNLLFFRLSLIPLLFTLLVAALSGVIGGIIGYLTYRQIDKSKLIARIRTKKTSNDGDVIFLEDETENNIEHVPDNHESGQEHSQNTQIEENNNENKD